MITGAQVIQFDKDNVLRVIESLEKVSGLITTIFSISILVVNQKSLIEFLI